MTLLKQGIGLVPPYTYSARDTCKCEIKLHFYLQSRIQTIAENTFMHFFFRSTTVIHFNDDSDDDDDKGDNVDKNGDDDDDNDDDNGDGDGDALCYCF